MVVENGTGFLLWKYLTNLLAKPQCQYLEINQYRYLADTGD